MARVRSPNYPQISLSEAIQRVAQVFAKERQHPAPKEVIMKHLGYSSVNGASMGTLSGIAKYGLLERLGEDYRVSDRAMTILYPPSTEAKAEALREAAKEPALFSEIFEYFGGVLPSDENLNSYLIRKGFADSGSKAVIRVLRETMEVVTSLEGAYTSQTSKQEASKPLQVQTLTQRETPQVATAVINDWHVAMTTNGLKMDAVLIDQEGIDRLIAILSANKTLLPQKASATPAKPVEASAAQESVDQSH